MLNTTQKNRKVGRVFAGRSGSVRRQRGVVLMISLIILVALSIAGIALVRSVDTTNVIAGNLAFQQAATRAADAGTEDAIVNVLQNPGGLSTVELQSDHTGATGRGYVASMADNPANAAAWDALWRATINPNPIATPTAPRSCIERVCSLPVDAAGNCVSYTIQRMCAQAGDPRLDATGCIRATRKMAGEGEDISAGRKPLSQITQYYYRVTTRVVGPRNTTSFIQTIIAR